MAEQQTIGLLVMAYGTPYRKADIAPYYAAIRHGRPPSDEQIASLASRYEAIGGLSPLAELTEQQAEALEETLNKGQTDFRFKQYLGLKYIHPFIEDAVKQMRADGIREAVSIVLAPHYSRFSVQSYHDRAASAAGGREALMLHPVVSWYAEDDFIAFWARQVKREIEQIPACDREKTIVLFSAHSLPERILKNGDPYPEQVADTARRIAHASGLSSWVQAWQSAGKTADVWLGPDVLEQVRVLSQSGNYCHYIFCPIGFVSEHLEVLYDNDTECRHLVEALGGVYHRPPMPDADPLFVRAMAHAVLRALRSDAAEKPG
ncbi:MAG: ferrochelatase [Sporolactobacillus sp.]